MITRRTNSVFDHERVPSQYNGWQISQRGSPKGHASRSTERLPAYAAKRRHGNLTTRASRISQGKPCFLNRPDQIVGSSVPLLSRCLSCAMLQHRAGTNRPLIFSSIHSFASRSALLFGGCPHILWLGAILTALRCVAHARLNPRFSW